MANVDNDRNGINLSEVPFLSIVLAILHAELRLCPAGTYLLHAELCLCPTESYLLCTDFKVFICQIQEELWGTFRQLWEPFSHVRNKI